MDSRSCLVFQTSWTFPIFYPQTTFCQSVVLTSVSSTGVLVNNEHDDAENGLCADTQLNLGGRVLGEEEKAQLYRFARQRGTQWDRALKTCVSQLWGTW